LSPVTASLSPAVSFSTESIFSIPQVNNDNGTASHTHELLNFRPIIEEVQGQGQGGGQESGASTTASAASQPAPKILVQLDNKSIFLRGVVDVGANHRIVWKNVDSAIYIKKGSKIYCQSS
jgi:hypothetical protein